MKSAAIAGLLAVPAIIMAVDHGHASALCTIDKVDWMSANQHALLANFETAALPFETTARRQPDRVVAAAFDNLSQRRLPIAFDASDRLRGTVSGNYQCRKIQLDEDAGYSYPYFRCRIEDDGEGLFQVRKTSGSQLFTGYLHRVTTNEDAQNPAGHLVYQGMFHAGGDDPKAWDKDDRDAEVGCMTGRADGSLVLEVPPQNGYQSHVLWEFRKR
ncbi:MAG: DUF4893 domain-containing protein [Pseudomonadota bacterium]